MVHPHSAGIDVGATEHSVCVPEDAVPAGESAVRQFRAFTGDLDQLVEWVRRCKVETVAMESTGVYWIPIYQKLERAGLEVVLVNARHLKRVPEPAEGSPSWWWSGAVCRPRRLHTTRSCFFLGGKAEACRPLIRCCS